MRWPSGPVRDNAILMPRACVPTMDCPYLRVSDSDNAVMRDIDALARGSGRGLVALLM